MGARNRATLLAQAMLEEEGEQIVRKVIDAALAGDLTAARLVLERLVPPVRERPITVTLKVDTSTPEGVSRATDAILGAACAGELLPSEAGALASIVEARRRAHETEMLERRVAALEERERKTA